MGKTAVMDRTIGTLGVPPSGVDELEARMSRLKVELHTEALCG
jgi:hypothetical protein